MEGASLIVPVFRDFGLTAGMLDTLVGNHGDGEIEVILALDVEEPGDDCTVDQVVRLMRRSPDFPLRIVSGEWAGFGRNCNRGLAEARFDVTVFLNNDLRMHQGWLPPMLKALGEDEIGLVGGLLWYEPYGRNGLRVQHAGMVFPDRENPIHLYRGLTAATAPGVMRPKSLQCVTGAILGGRTEEIRKLGGFHEAYRNGWEDCDLCFTVRKELKKHVLYLPAVQAVHLEGVTRNKPSSKSLPEDEGRKIFLGRYRDMVEVDYEAVVESDGGIRL